MAPPALVTMAYCLLNIVSSTGVVMANKTVFSIFDFHFAYILTLCHTLVTMFGMEAFLRMGLFERKQVPRAQLLPLARAYVGYIVLCNLNLNANPLGFYQITKIAVGPAVLAIEVLWYCKKVTWQIAASVLVMGLGMGLATVTDPQLSSSNLAGMAAGLGSVIATALYQIWAGSKQKELGLGSMQLLHQYVPLAAGLLALLVPVFEPMGWQDPAPDTLLGYRFTPGSIVAIAVSSILGLLVNLSTFLLIGATSSLTYNAVSCIKMVAILTGGVLFFGDSMYPQKAAGIVAAVIGALWYSHAKLVQARAAAAAAPVAATAATAAAAAEAASAPAATKGR